MSVEETSSLEGQSGSASEAQRGGGDNIVLSFFFFPSLSLSLVIRFQRRKGIDRGEEEPVEELGVGYFFFCCCWRRRLDMCLDGRGRRLV